MEQARVKEKREKAMEKAREEVEREQAGRRRS